MVQPPGSEERLVRYSEARARSAALCADSHRLREASARLRLQVRGERDARLGAGPGDEAPANGRGPLTARQHEILTLIAEGLGTRAIAERLWLSPATIRNHVAAILVGLDAHSRLEAVAKARRLGVLASSDGRR